MYSLLKLHPEKSEKQLLWNSEHQQSFDQLLSHLTTPPMLAYPDFHQPFKLYTDASGQGLGCALYQEQNGKLRILGLGSRTLVGAEKKYHSSKLEFLGLKWVIGDHFRDYLYYAEYFDVYTDFNPLTYINTSCKLNATGQRWVNVLTNFQFYVNYQPSIQNNVADLLSRFPKSSQDLEKHGQICSVEEVRAIFDGSFNQANG